MGVRLRIQYETRRNKYLQTEPFGQHETKRKSHSGGRVTGFVTTRPRDYKENLLVTKRPGENLLVEGGSLHHQETRSSQRESLGHRETRRSQRESLGHHETISLVVSARTTLYLYGATAIDHLKKED